MQQKCLQEEQAKDEVVVVVVVVVGDVVATPDHPQTWLSRFSGRYKASIDSQVSPARAALWLSPSPGMSTVE